MPEEGVISDLIAEPNLPCQGSPRQIRSIARFARWNDTEIQKARDMLALRNDQLATFQEYKEDDRRYNGAVKLGFYGSLAGILYGLPKVLYRVGQKRNEEDREEEEESPATS